jgi:4-amino-4-deoxy-L-arabinose transferase-like glycosyltransferase
MVGWALIAHEKRFLLCLFVGALILRVVFFYCFLRNNPLQLAYDSGHYHAVATAVSQGHGFVNADGSPHFYRLPGYPLFLATCYKLFNYQVALTLLAQCVVASLIPLLAFGISLLLFPGAVVLARCVALVCAVHPGFLIFSGLVMSETLFVLAFLLFIIFFIASLQRGSSAYACGAGIMLGCASLIRPVGAFLFIVSMTAIFLYTVPWRTKFLQSLFFLFGMGIGCGPWLMRNFLLTGSLFLQTFSGPHLLNHGASRVLMYAHHTSYAQAQKMAYHDIDNLVHSASCILGGKIDEVERSRLVERYAFATLLQHPLPTLKLCVSNVCKTLFSLYAAELLCIDAQGVLPPYDANRTLRSMILRFIAPSVHNLWLIPLIYGEIFLNFFLLVGIFGWFLMVLRKRYEVSGNLMIVLALSSVIIALSCVCGFARLRLPVEPFFIMLAMMFWGDVIRKRVV